MTRIHERVRPQFEFASGIGHILPDRNIPIGRGSLCDRNEARVRVQSGRGSAKRQLSLVPNGHEQFRRLIRIQPAVTVATDHLM